MLSYADFIDYCVYVFDKKFNKLSALISLCCCSINVFLISYIILGGERKPQIVIFQSEGTAGEGTVVRFLMDWKP